jgi:radical SAM superfamily enzyme YgiQ (UPF0313 family)
MGKKNILFTMSYVDKKLYDYWEANTTDSFFRFRWLREGSAGLRWIKQNIPEIEILENPTLKEFKEKLAKKKYDIVGFSFYLNETPRIIEMIDYARSVGVKTIWGGNYGVLTKEIQKYFDKIFLGYAEEEIAKELGKKIGGLVHPPLIGYVGTPSNIQILRSGAIQTIRGCTFKCTFCQTTAFCKKITTMPLESIDAVLKEYKKRGIREIFLMDENFGIIKDYSDKVTDLMMKYKLNWYVMTRADILDVNLEKWREKGLIGVLIGIENLSQDNLDIMKKSMTNERIINLIKKMNNYNMWITGFYMIGCPNETRESILRDMKILKSFKLDQYQICILTPFPETPLWTELDKKYGIWDKDYSHYDAKYLVWNHPNIKPEEMTDILKKSFKIVYSRENFINSFKKFYKKYTLKYGRYEGLKYMYMGIIKATLYRYFKREYKPIYFKNQKNKDLKN